jgi:Domain of unknown function (DUF4116)
MACLKKGWSVLELVVAVDENSPHLSDQEIIRLATEHNPDAFQYASVTLRQDREFVLSLVSAIDRGLHHAPAMKTDKDILAAAMARSAGTISDCCFVSCSSCTMTLNFSVTFPASSDPPSCSMICFGCHGWTKGLRLLLPCKSRL